MYYTKTINTKILKILEFDFWLHNDSNSRLYSSRHDYRTTKLFLIYTRKVGVPGHAVARATLEHTGFRVSLKGPTDQARI